MAEMFYKRMRMRSLIGYSTPVQALADHHNSAAAAA